MPKIPKWMANAMESLFSGMYHPVTVTEVSYITPKLKKVRFEGDFSKSKKEFVPGNVIEFRINDNEFRHYTPSFWDMKSGVCESYIYLHDKGPGSKWIDNLKQQDRLKLLGPGGKIKYDSSASIHIAFGDETSLGLFNCLQNEARSKGHTFKSLAHLKPEHAHWPVLLGIQTQIIAEETSGTDNILEWLNHGNRESMTFYLTGNAKSIVVLKKFLLVQEIPNHKIQTEPYWSEGKTGL